MLVPVTLIINALFYNTHTTTKVKISLFILLAGVGVAVSALPRFERRAFRPLPSTLTLRGRRR